MEESLEKYAANLAVTNGQKEKSGGKSREKFDGISGGSLGEKMVLFLSSLMFPPVLKRSNLVWIVLCFIFPSCFFISSSHNLLRSICVINFPTLNFADQVS